jgi:hypothetical protein
MVNRVITNKLDRLERSLKRKLLSFYNSKIKGSPIPVDVLKQKYNQQVRDLIRKTAEESYLIGTDTVGSQILAKDQEFQLFISATDLTNIQGLTDRLSNDFWNTAQRLQDREFTVTPEGVKKTPFDSLAAMTGIAAGLVFSAFNNAIKSKSTQVTQTPFENIRANNDQLISQSLNLDVGFEIRPVGKVMFVTKRDSKVDPDICAPLDGTTWFVDDPSIVTPPDDTHRFCRCTLEPVIE